MFLGGWKAEIIVSCTSDIPQTMILAGVQAHAISAFDVSVIPRLRNGSSNLPKDLLARCASLPTSMLHFHIRQKGTQNVAKKK